jgi:hypothetical protein
MSWMRRLWSNLDWVEKFEKRLVALRPTVPDGEVPTAPTPQGYPEEEPTLLDDDIGTLDGRVRYPDAPGPVAPGPDVPPEQCPAHAPFDDSSPVDPYADTMYPPIEPNAPAWDPGQDAPLDDDVTIDEDGPTQMRPLPDELPPEPEVPSAPAEGIPAVRRPVEPPSECSPEPPPGDPVAATEVTGAVEGVEGGEGAAVGGTTGSVSAAVPVIGAVIGATATVAVDYDDVRTGRKKAGDATAEVAVNATIGASSALAAAEAGAALGAELGTAIPIPFVGTALGFLGGAVVGAGVGYLESKIAGATGATKAVGKYLDDHAEKPLEEVWQAPGKAVDAVADAAKQSVQSVEAVGAAAEKRAEEERLHQGHSAGN